MLTSVLKWKANSLTSNVNLGLLKPNVKSNYKFGFYLVLSIMRYTTVVSVIQVCRVVRLLWSDVNLIVLRGLSFLGPQRRHRRRRQRHLYLPSLEPTDSTRTRGPTHRGARPTTRSHYNALDNLQKRPHNTHSAIWNTRRPLLDYGNFYFIRNIKE